MVRQMSDFDATAYSIVVTKAREDDEDPFFAYVKEVPDISSYGNEFQDVYDDCIDSLNVLHADAVANGKIFPLPDKAALPSAPSGRVTLRMSRTMHADIARCADEDGVSLNQWIVEAIAQRRGYYVVASSFAGSRILSMTSAAIVSTISRRVFGHAITHEHVDPVLEFNLLSSDSRREEASTFPV